MSTTAKAGGSPGPKWNMVNKKRAGQGTTNTTRVPTWLLFYKRAIVVNFRLSFGKPGAHNYEILI